MSFPLPVCVFGTDDPNMFSTSALFRLNISRCEFLSKICTLLLLKVEPLFLEGWNKLLSLDLMSWLFWVVPSFCCCWSFVSPIQRSKHFSAFHCTGLQIPHHWACDLSDLSLGWINFCLRALPDLKCIRTLCLENMLNLSDMGWLCSSASSCPVLH